MIVIKKEHELDAMRIAARKTATILRAVADRVAPGVTTGELDAYAAELAKRQKVVVRFMDIMGFLVIYALRLMRKLCMVFRVGV